jgi:hypothetical protein
MAETRDFVQKQIESMQSDVFEIGLFKLPSPCDIRTPAMIPRVWDSETLLKSISWLRFQNLKGRNIYIRPKGEHGLSLVDDLSNSSINRMINEGFRPAAIVETSPGNFQAWLNHGERLTKEIGTAAARGLAERFGGDTKAADWRHFGRLAGFTNRKPKHCDLLTGLFPFVRLIQATGTVYPQAARFIACVREQFERDQQLRRDRTAGLISGRRSIGAAKPIDAFRGNPTYGGDGTRIDLAYALYALSRGVTEGEVKAAIRTRDLSHKGSERRQEDYIERTIRKALALRHQTVPRGR